jgi:hypothetical protein
MTLPCRAGALPNSRSPIVADGGAVIGPLCRTASLIYWSILLIHRNFMNFGAPDQLWQGELPAGASSVERDHDDRDDEQCGDQRKRAIE